MQDKLHVAWTLGAMVCLFANVLAAPIPVVTCHYQRTHYNINTNSYEVFFWTFNAFYLEVEGYDMQQKSTTGNSGRPVIKHSFSTTSKYCRINWDCFESFRELQGDILCIKRNMVEVLKCQVKYIFICFIIFYSYILYHETLNSNKEKLPIKTWMGTKWRNLRNSKTVQ